MEVKTYTPAKKINVVNRWRTSMILCFFLRGGGLVAFYRNTLIYNDVYVNFLHTNLSYTMASGGRWEIHLSVSPTGVWALSDTCLSLNGTLSLWISHWVRFFWLFKSQTTGFLKRHPCTSLLQRLYCFSKSPLILSQHGETVLGR